MSPVLAAVALVSYGVVLCCPSPSYTPKNPMRCLECPQGFSRATCTVSKASAEQCVGGVKMRKPHRYVRMSQEAAAAAASAPIAPSSAPRNSRCCAAGRGQTQRLWRGNGTPASLRTHRAGSTHGEPPGVPWHHGDSGERQPAAAEAGIQGRVLNPRDGKPAQPGEATQRPTGGGPRHGAPAALPSRVNSRPENGGAAPRPLRVSPHCHRVPPAGPQWQHLCWGAPPHPAASAPQDGSCPLPAGTGSGGWCIPRCLARSARSPAAAWPRSGTGCFSLSVRHSTRSSWDSVTHYRIHRLENGWLYISPRLTFPSLRDLVEHYSGNAATPRAPVCVWGALCPAGSGRGGGGWSPPPRCPRGWGAQGTLLTVPAARPEFGEGLCCTLREPCSVEGARVATAPALPTVVKKPPLSWDKIDSSMLLSEAASLPEEDSPISLGLREAISSYLLLTDAPEQSPTGKGAKSS
ncbi:src-like-adapter 2 isoform X2 [Cuculus canorus]|uniref:src-like-adapter 2 isoform X2 n=1 Tax=Cuculus canorus TaxID=55661 RepID=UPI0023AA5FCA|nr:src-like-adapter 2 isoform X2 [Cuculus canorus]